MIALAVIAPIVAYLLGSISFAVIFTNYFSKTDVREHGSGNAGTTNVLRVSGKKAGALTFICDIIKGTLAVLLGSIIYSFVFKGNENVILYGEYLCAVSCMLGHAFPIFFKFKGGKCAATSVGIFAVCCPIGIAVALVCFAISMIFSRIVSVSTLIATLVVVGFSIGLNGFNDGKPDYLIFALTFVAGFIVFYRHKDNIKRLIKGEEKKLKMKK